MYTYVYMYNNMQSNTTSSTLEWPALWWNFPKRKKKTGIGKNEDELTCLLLITKTKLRERVRKAV